MTSSGGVYDRLIRSLGSSTALRAPIDSGVIGLLVGVAIGATAIPATLKNLCAPSSDGRFDSAPSQRGAGNLVILTWIKAGAPRGWSFDGSRQLENDLADRNLSRHCYLSGRLRKPHCQPRLGHLVHSRCYATLVNRPTATHRMHCVNCVNWAALRLATCARSGKPRQRRSAYRNDRRFSCRYNAIEDPLRRYSA